MTPDAYPLGYEHYDLIGTLRLAIIRYGKDLFRKWCGKFVL